MRFTYRNIISEKYLELLNRGLVMIKLIGNSIYYLFTLLEITKKIILYCYNELCTVRYISWKEM